MIDPTRPRYFVVSPFKTGTTSVERALLQIGAASRAMPYDRTLFRKLRTTFAEHRGAARKAGDLALYQSEHGEAARDVFGSLTKALTRYDIFADAPFGHGHVHPFTLRTLSPTARFIWVHRDFGEWSESVKAWELARPDLYSKAPLWESDPEQRIADLRLLRKRRNWAFKAAERSFPEACLRLDLSEGSAMSQLGAFCGMDACDMAFPHENQRT